MGWLWQNYNPEAFYRVDAKPASPCIEAEEAGDGDIVAINPLPRFREIFLPLFDEEAAWRSLPRETAENLFLHFLARLDRLSGINRAFLQREKLARELENGDYGEKARKLFTELDARERETVCAFLARQRETGGRRLFFLECFHVFFPQSVAYCHTPDDMYLFYMGKERNDKDAGIIELLEELFWDISSGRRKYYWHSHFGIIGVNGTMRMGQIRIY